MRVDSVKMMTTFNFFTSVAWISAGIISIVLSLSFLLKNPRKRLNQLFASGFICWSISLLFNGLTFTIAYSSLAAANILRNICVAAGILSALFLFIASIGIYFGAEAIHWLLYLGATILAIVMISFGVLNDWVVPDGVGGYKTTDNLLGKSFVQLIPAALVIFGAILLTITYFKLENPQAKKRIGFFIIGFSTIILGLLLFLIDSFVTFSPYLFPSLAIVTWVTGPLLMLIGFYIKVTAYTAQAVQRLEPTPQSKTLDPNRKNNRPS